MSKFQSLLDVANRREEVKQSKKPARKKITPVDMQPVATVASRRGRPTGKRSDPNYEQITAYIRKETHKDVKIALLQEGQGREFSELVEDLLSDWLKARI